MQRGGAQQMLDVQIRLQHYMQLQRYEHSPCCRRSCEYCSASVPVPSSFMFVTTTARKPHSSHYVLEMGLEKWNIHFLDCSLADFMRYLWTVQSREPAALEMTPSNSLWWGTEEEEEERVCEDKSCWSSESRFISLLNRSPSWGSSG